MPTATATAVLRPPRPAPASPGDPGRSAGAEPAPSPPDTVATHLDRLADLAARGQLPPAHRLADVLRLLLGAAAEEVDGLAADPPGADAPAVVQHRAIGRLAARTAGRTLVLDARTAAELRAAWGPGAAPATPSRSCRDSGRFPLLDVA